jgi:hypothetical protein
MSREAPQKPVGQYPWYYRDVPVWIIAASATAAVVIFFVTEFRPVRTAPPVTVVAHQDAPPPWKAILPDRLPPPLPALPPPPVISSPDPPHSALDTILSKTLSAPAHPSETPLLALRYSVLKQLPGGAFVQTGPPQELAENDRPAIHFESSDSGFLTVFEQSPDGWQKTFTGEVPSSSGYTFAPPGTRFPETGSRQFLILFSRNSQNPEPSQLDTLSPVNPVDSPQPGFIVQATPQNPELLAFTLTLTYTLR